VIGAHLFSEVPAAAIAVSSAVVVGCSLTLGPTGTSGITQARSQHVGGTITAQTRLPRDYRYIVGVEESLLGQASPESRADQWRVAALGGYSRAPTAGGTPLGWEAALRLGFFRGSNGLSTLRWTYCKSRSRLWERACSWDL